MSKVKKLTPNLLKRLVLEEKKKLGSGAREVKAKDMAHSLANKIYYLKALKIHESGLRKKLKRIMTERAKIKNQIVKDL